METTTKTASVTITNTRLAIATAFLGAASLAAAAAGMGAGKMSLAGRTGYGEYNPAPVANPVSIAPLDNVAAAATYVFWGDPAAKQTDLFGFKYKLGSLEDAGLKSLAFRFVKKEEGLDSQASSSQPTCLLTNIDLLGPGGKTVANAMVNSTPAPGSAPLVYSLYEQLSGGLIIPKGSSGNYYLRAAAVTADDLLAPKVHGCTFIPEIHPQDIELIGASSADKLIVASAAPSIKGPPVTVLAAAPRLSWAGNAPGEGSPNGGAVGAAGQVVASLLVENHGFASTSISLANLPFTLYSTAPLKSGQAVNVYAGEPGGNAKSSLLYSAKLVPGKGWIKKKDATYEANIADKITAPVILEGGKTKLFTVVLDTPGQTGQVCVKARSGDLVWKVGSQKKPQRGADPSVPELKEVKCLDYGAVAAPTTTAQQPVIKEMRLETGGNPPVVTSKSAAQSSPKLGNFYDGAQADVGVPDMRAVVKLTVDGAAEDTQYGFYVLSFSYFKGNFVSDKPEDSFASLVMPGVVWTAKPEYSFVTSSSKFVVYALVKNGDAVYPFFPNLKIDDATYINVWAKPALPIASSTPQFGLLPFNGTLYSGGNVPVASFFVRNQTLTKPTEIALKSLPLTVSMSSLPQADRTLSISKLEVGSPTLATTVLQRVIKPGEWKYFKRSQTYEFTVSDAWSENVVIETGGQRNFQVTFDTLQVKPAEFVCVKVETGKVTWSQSVAPAAYVFTGVKPEYGLSQPTCLVK